jgi:signal peptidase
LITVSNSETEKSALITSGKLFDINSEYFFQGIKKPSTLGKSKVKSRKFTIIGKVFSYLSLTVLLGITCLSYTGIMKARIVLTGSMVPSINPGDLIITVPPSRHVPVKGDVVAYQGRRFDGTPVGVFSHRIIGGDAINGFVVKGDANPSPDVQKPKTSDITGVVVVVIPFIGKLLSPRLLLVLAPVILGLWLVVDALRE